MRFMFCDRILELEPGKRIRAAKSVSQIDGYLNDHYPLRQIMPASMVLESMAQTGGWLVQTSYGFSLQSVIVIVEDYEVHRLVRAGETLELEAFLLRVHGSGATLRCEVRIGAEPIASVRRMVYAHEAAVDDGFAVQRRRYFDYISGGFELPGP